MSEFISILEKIRPGYGDGGVTKITQGKDKGKYHLRIGSRKARKVYRGDKSKLEKILKNYKDSLPKKGDYVSKLTPKDKKAVLEWGKNKGLTQKKALEAYNKLDATTRSKIRTGEVTGKGFSSKPGAVKPLSPENAKLFAKTNPGEVWGKGNFSTPNQRGNWLIDAPRKKQILKKTKGLITEAELSKILTKALGEDITPTKIYGRYGKGKVTEFGKVAQGLSKGTFGSIAGGDTGGSLKYYRRPNAADIKKFKGALEYPLQSKLGTKTVNNILALDSKYRQVYRDGNLPLIADVVKDTGMKATDAGRATARLSQIYSGHVFKNPELEVIRKNVSAGNKLFEKMSKAPFGDVYRSGLYDAALDTIDIKLGRKQGTFASLKSKARKILQDNKIKGFDINEIAGVTGSSKSGAEFSQFIDVMEENLNRKTFANLQSQLSQAKESIKKNPKKFKFYADRFNKNALVLADRYNVGVPQIIRPEDVTSAYGTKRLAELKKQGLNLIKAAKRDRFGIKVPEGSMTIEEFTDPNNPKTKAHIRNIKKFADANGFTLNSFAGVVDLSQAGITIPPNVRRSLNAVLDAGSKVLRAGGKAAVVIDPIFAAMDFSKAMGEGVSGKEATAYTGQKFLQDIFNLPRALEDLAYVTTDKGTFKNFGEKENRLFSYEPRVFADEYLQEKIKATPEATRDFRKARIDYAETLPIIDYMDTPMSQSEAKERERAFYLERGVEPPEEETDFTYDGIMGIVAPKGVI